MAQKQKSHGASGSWTPKSKPAKGVDYPNFIGGDKFTNALGVLAELLKGQPSSLHSPFVPQQKPQLDLLNRTQSPLRQDIIPQPLNAPPAPPAPIQDFFNVQSGSSTSKPKEEKKPNVKIEAPLEDLAELIYGSISGDDKEEPKPLELQQNPYDFSQSPASRPAIQIDETPISQMSQMSQVLPIEEEGYNPVNFKAQSSQSPKELSVYDRLKSTLSAAPMREDFKPSKLRRVLGSIAGGLTGAAFGPESGYKMGENIVQAPYRESYQDWLVKSGALEKEAEIALKEGKLNQDDYTNYINHLKELRAQDEFDLQNDPEHQRKLSGAKKKGEEEALEPGRVAKERREQADKLALEAVQTARAESVANITQGGANARSAAQIAQAKKTLESVETRARAAISSRENISRLNREMQKAIAEGKNQRVPPNQQIVAQIAAANEVGRTVADPEEFEALFEETANGIRLKNRNSIPKEWIRQFNRREEHIERLKKSIITNSVSPTSLKDTEDEEDFEIEEDQFEIEEI